MKLISNGCKRGSTDGGKQANQSQTSGRTSSKQIVALFGRYRMVC